MTIVRAIHGNITEMVVDAVVNAANSALLGGGGVDGAIHRAAGPQLLEECRKLGGCRTGEAKITQGYNLPAKYVIHTVGPVYRDGNHGEEELLAACYSNSLRLGVENSITSIAFPSISTGAYRYPIEEAARVAVSTVTAFINEETELSDVLFCCFSANDLNIYRKILDQETR